MLYINMVYTYYMVCVTCVLIKQLVPARPPKELKRRHTSPNDKRLPLVVLRGCFCFAKFLEIPSHVNTI